MHRLRTVTLLDVSAVAGHHAMPAALLLEVNLTSFPPKCFFLKNKIEIFKTFPKVLFSFARLCTEKIDTAASNREAVNNFETDATLW